MRKILSRSTSVVAIAVLGALLALPLCLSAGQKEDLWKKAADAVNKGRTEEAKDAWCELAKLDPAYQNSETNCTIYKGMFDQRVEIDEKILDDGREAMRQKHYDEAIQKFGHVQTSKAKQTAESLSQEARNAKAAEEQAKVAAEKAAIEKAAAEKASADKAAAEKLAADKAAADKLAADKTAAAKTAEEAKREEQVFQTGVQAYKSNNFDMAISNFQKVTGQKQNDAMAYLQKIKDYRNTVKEGDNANANKKLPSALASYRKAERIKPDGPDDLQKKIRDVTTQLDKSEKENPDQLLVQGIDDFYKGDYEAAKDMLDQYAGKGKKKALRDFYLGASLLSSSYVVADSTKQQALLEGAKNAFRQAKQERQFSPPRDKVSPKILKVYEKTPAA